MTPILFEQLSGEQLSAVTFVQDYLQLWFDGPGLNIVSPVTVYSAGKHATSWNEGFRDLLCGQITKKVVKVSLFVDKSLEIDFVDESRISISIRRTDYSSPEAVYGHGFKNNESIVL